MSDHENFMLENASEIARQGADPELLRVTRAWFNSANARKYSYHFQSLGRPIIQYPQDIVAVQEILWDVRPDLIIETGIARGGSLIMSAGMLALLDYCDAVETGELLDPRRPRRHVLGIDIDIRQHNREAIEAHPLASRISMIQGSSIEPALVEQVRERVAALPAGSKVLVCLDSMHTHDHVLAELHAYAPLVSVGSYCIVFDTVIEDMPEDFFPDRPWGKHDNPKTAVREFLKDNQNFEIDRSIPDKLLITVAPDGYLKRTA